MGKQLPLVMGAVARRSGNNLLQRPGQVAGPLVRQSCSQLKLEDRAKIFLILRRCSMAETQHWVGYTQRQ